MKDIELELGIERDLRRLYILANYKSKHYKLAFLILYFKSMIPNRNYKSVDDNSCCDRGLSSDIGRLSSVGWIDMLFPLREAVVNRE